MLRNCTAPTKTRAPTRSAPRRNEEELPKELLEAPFLGDAAQRVALPGRHGCPLAPKTKNLGADDLRAGYIACVTC